MAGVKQQVNGFPLVGDGGVTNHLVVADVRLRDSTSQSVEAEIWPNFPHWEGVQALVPQQDHMVQLAEMLYNKY